ncbi:MAG: UvrB/UvrC motif-containing protein, partial [Desulfovibrio sp.]|nr:UvrB/UvrC motif-containing protein [Desulfovibrio sp.]
AILQALRKGDFDVLVGINLLREGLDLPEVSLVAILDADKEGFLRSTRSLIQTFGRAARNVAGLVVLYADTITPSMRAAMDETERRRARQIAHNQAHGIVPQSVRKEAENVLDAIHAQARQREQQEGGKLRRGKGQAPAPEADQATPAALAAEEAALYGADPKRAAKEIKTLERQMREAARELEFERAAQLRDRIKRLRELLTEAATSAHA